MSELENMKTNTNKKLKEISIDELEFLKPPDLKEYGIGVEAPKKKRDFLKKLAEKAKANPFVPFGLTVTVFALTYGMYQMKTRNQRMSQQMMRLRVGGQAFTVLAVLGGVLYSSVQTKEQSNT